MQQFNAGRDEPATSTLIQTFGRDGRLLISERLDRYGLVDTRDTYTYDARGCVTALHTQDGPLDSWVNVTRYQVNATCDVLGSRTVDPKGEELSRSTFTYAQGRESGEVHRNGEVVQRVSSRLNAQGRVAERTVVDAQGALHSRERWTYHANGEVALRTSVLRTGSGWWWQEMSADPQGEVVRYRRGSLSRDVDPLRVAWKDLVRFSGPSCFQEAFEPGTLDAQGRWTSGKWYRVSSCDGTGDRDLRAEVGITVAMERKVGF
ncbi:hypothetical protein F8S09_15630 [Deinococcus sp. SDU3-2]|uniref:RHS repeat protein n=1 Tax=Deinococcus terrestris TaxID=2651870 RepID=A0A7X1NYE1_9DEIO|nr:hypothetical protein [Deinococcus terrestris]MPY68087.1 hypothetical protein [Deinococcus terrestris]